MSYPSAAERKPGRSRIRFRLSVRKLLCRGIRRCKLGMQVSWCGYGDNTAKSCLPFPSGIVLILASRKSTLAVSSIFAGIAGGKNPGSSQLLHLQSGIICQCRKSAGFGKATDFSAAFSSKVAPFSITSKLSPISAGETIEQGKPANEFKLSQLAPVISGNQECGHLVLQFGKSPFQFVHHLRHSGIFLSSSGKR